MATQISLIDEEYKIRFKAAKKVIKTEKLLLEPFNLHKEIIAFFNNYKEDFDIWLAKIKGTKYCGKYSKNVLKLDYYMMNAHQYFYKISDNSWIHICIVRL